MTTYDRAKTINSLAVAMGMQPVSRKDMTRYVIDSSEIMARKKRCFDVIFCQEHGDDEMDMI